MIVNTTVLSKMKNTVALSVTLNMYNKTICWTHMHRDSNVRPTQIF